MAKYSSSVHYNITTSLDASGITKLQAELNKIEHELNILSKRELIGDAAVTDALSDIKRIQNALTTAFNPKLGMMNMNTFMSELTKGGRSLTQIYDTLGNRSTSAMANLAGQLGKIDTGMKSVSKTTDKIFNTIGNTVRWGVIASGFQYVLNSAHGAVQYMRDLDESLTNIRLVTDESKESMREFALYANEAAKNLGNTTVAYTDAALIYAQQGYGLSDQKKLADITLMTANVTGQATGEVSEQMTSLINGYQLKVDEVQGAMDKLAEVANVSAADLEELATATSKVASTANALGVTQDELTAQIATIVSVTREAPENVGNALKTIYARLGDLQMGETLEDGTNLGNLSGQLEAIGVQVMDASGGMRGMGDIMEDLMAMWDQLDVGTKQALAVKLAGKYQYNRLMALMENDAKYTEYLTASENSAGTLDEMQSEYMESLEGKINALVASLQGALTSLFDQDSLGPMIEGLTEIVDLFTQLTEAIGGGEAALTAMSAVGLRMFSGNIGRGISNIIANRQSGQQAKANVEAAQANANAQLAGQGINTNDQYMKQFLQDNAMINRNATAMSDEQIQKANQALEERKNVLIQVTEAQKKYDQTVIQLKAAYSVLGVSEEAAEQGLRAFLQTLEADGVSLEDSKEQLDQLTSSLTNLQRKMVGLDQIIQGLDPNSAAVDWNRIQQQAQDLIPIIGKNRKTLQDLGMTSTQVNNILKALGKTANGDQKDFQGLSQMLQKCGFTVDSFREALGQVKQSLVLTDKEIEKIVTELFQAQVAFNATSQGAQGFAHQLANQNVATHIANITSGVTSLMFALQSIKSLGSIWADEDLSLGEKFFQTLMNGTMTVSMLAMGYMEIADATKALKEETKASTLVEALSIKIKEAKDAINKKLILTEQKLAIAAGQQTAALGAEATAATAATTANIGLAGSLRLVGAAFGPFIAIAAAGAAALAGLGYAVNKIEEDYKSVRSVLEESTGLVESITSQQSSLEGLYQEYKSTGEVSEEFKNTLITLAEELNISGAALMVQSGNYETLKQKIDETIASQIQYNGLAAAAAATGAYETGGEAWVTYGDEQVFANAAVGNQRKQDRLSQEILDKTAQRSEISQNTDPSLSVEEKNEQLIAIDREIEELQNDLAATKQIAIDAQYSDYLNYASQALSSSFEGDLAGGLLENISSQSANGIIEGIKGLYGTALDRLYGEGDSEEKTNAIVEMAHQVAEKYDNAEASAELIAKYMQDASAATENQTYEENIDQKLADLGVSPEGFEAYKDESGIETILEQEKADILDKKAKATEKYKKARQEVDRLERQGIKSGEKYEKALKEQTEAKEELNKATEETIEATAEFEDKLESTAAKSLSTAIGLQELSKNFEDNKEAITSSAVGSEEWQKAADDIKSSLEKIMNVEAGTFDNQFIIDNLEEIEAAANGSEEAIQNLRNATVEKIMLDAGISPEAHADVYNEMMNLIAMAEQILPDIETGASIDDTAFMAALQSMVENAAAAGATIDEIIGALNGMGLDANIYWEKVPSYKNATYDNESDTNPGIVTGGVEWIEVPKIQWVTKTGGITKGYGGYSGGSGGGGGGGGYEPKTQDRIEEEPDRYQDVNAHLERLEKTLEGVANEQDRLSRSEVIANLKEQASIIQEQVEWQEKKLALQKEEAQEIKNELAALGVTFDSEGYMTNYAETHQKLVNEVNSLIDKYNATSSEEGQEALAEQIEDAKEKLSEFEELWQKYDELVNGSILDTINLLEELEDQIEDLNIEAFNTQLEAQEVLKDTAEAWIDLQSIINNFGEDSAIRDITNSIAKLGNAFDNALVSGKDYYTGIRSAMSELYTNDISDSYRKFLDAQMEAIDRAEAAGTGTVTSYGSGYLDMLMLNVDTITEQIEEYAATGTSRIFGENSAAMWEAAEEIYQSGRDALQEFEDEYKNLRQAQLALIDEIGDAMDEHMQKFQNITDELEHHLAMVELLYGDEAYEQQSMIRDALLVNVNGQIQSAKAQLELLKEEQAKIDDVESEAWKKLQDRIVETQGELNSLAEQAVQIARDREAAMVSSITNKWVSGALGTDLEWMETQWELINRNADYYLDDVNSAYEIQKLQGKYLEMLDNAGAVDSQKQITAQMKEQLEYLRGKTKLSEYDVAYANAQLEILQKRIALEEAQANKSQMKLRRDSQGNYSYVYTANEDAVRSASAELLDAENNAYNLSKEQMIATQEDSMSALAEAQDLINNIWTNTNLSLEEKTARTQTIIDSLKTYLQSTEEQLETSQINIISDFISMCDILVEENEFKLNDVYDQIIAGNDDAFSEIDTRWDTSITKWLYNMDDFLVETDGVFKELVSNAQYTEEQISGINESAGQSYDDLGKIIDDCRRDTEKLIGAGDDFIKNLQSQAQFIYTAEAALKSYAATMNAIDWSKLLGLGESIAAQNSIVASTGSASAGSSSSDTSDTSDLEIEDDVPTTNTNKSDLSDGVQVGDVAGYTGKYYYDSYGQTPAGNLYAGKANAIKIDSYSNKTYGGNTKTTGSYGVHIKSADGKYPDLGWIKASQLFDTGGYTGNWSDGFNGAKNGKLAWLHQKELILNANDTENILAAVQAVREITGAMKDGVFSKITTMLPAFRNNALTNDGQKLEQEVHITATFPNASDAMEIKEALTSLVDEASQWVNRYR